MAPKKRADEPAVAAILREAGVQSAKQITDSTLRKIYRLEDDVPVPQGAAISDGGLDNFLTRPRIHKFKACDNAWNTPEKRKEALARVSARTSKSDQKKKLRPVHDDTETGQPVLDLSCNMTNCRDNPRCLNWLGQHLWKDDEACQRFAKQWGLSDNPMQEARDPDLPVGLKNLGATCYVNSYLQVWYQNEPFRRAVFSCAPDPTKDLVKQPLYHLQVIFAVLQAAQMKAFSPTDLVKSLDINTSDQQDAQEFAKLLMTLLENEFAKQEDPELKTLIAKQFEGKIKYGTRCTTCKNRSENMSSFKEIEVPLKNRKSLQEQLRVAFEHEMLTGDNKYRCEFCKKLREAERYTEIVQLPPVLHFSLMRFGYDFKANERRKSAACINFPKSIDMSEFVTDAQESEWYDLRGILIHKGASAHHGHYVAQIHDAKLKQWFLFDDETVTALELVGKPDQRPSKRPRTATPPISVNRANQRPERNKRKSKSIAVDLSSSSSESDTLVVRSGPYRKSSPGISWLPSSSGTTAKKRKGVDSTAMEENRVATDDLIKSKDAYMLVYVRRASTSTIPGDPPAIPSIVQQKLQEIDRELTVRMNEYVADDQECRMKFKIRRDQKRAVYEVWNQESDSEPALLVDKDALQAWLTAEITPERKESSGNIKPKARQVDRDVRTDESEIDSIGVTSKRVPEEPATKLQQNGSGAGQATNVEHRGVPIRGNATSNGGQQRMLQTGFCSDEELPHLPTILPHSRYPKTCTNGASPGAVKADANGHTLPETSVMVSEPLAEDRDPTTSVPQNGGTRSKGVRKVRKIWSDNLLCAHGNVKPSASSHMKRISHAGMAQLIATDIVIGPEMITPDSLCRQCVFEPIQNRTYVLEHKKHVAEFEALSNEQGNPFWISKTWLEDWKKAKPSMYDEESDTQPPPDDPTYLHQVLCEHDGLLPNKQGRALITGSQTKFLQELFPHWIPVSQDVAVCKICKDTYARQLQHDRDIKAGADADKGNKWLRRLIAIPSLTQHEIVATREDEELRAIPREWTASWREWLKKPTLNERPRAIDLRPFFCEHIGMPFDLNAPVDRKEFEIIYQNEWQALVEAYGSKGGLALVVKQMGNGHYATRPSVCQPCRQHRRLAFVDIEIELRFLNNDEDMDQETNLPRTACEHTRLSIGNLPLGLIVAKVLVDEHEEGERSLSPMRIVTQGTRRSARQRKKPRSSLGKPNSAQRRKPEYLKVNKLDTLKDIRIKIQDITNTPTLYQRIFFKNREIEESAESIESIGITQGESLQVLLLEVPNEDDIDIGSIDESVPVSKRSNGNTRSKPKTNGRPEGFGGTALLGLDVRPDKARLDREREEAAILAAMPGSCPVCTYQNAAKARRCEMCDSEIS